MNTGVLIQLVVVNVAVVAAVVYLAMRAVRRARNRNGCDCGCGTRANDVVIPERRS